MRLSVEEQTAVREAAKAWRMPLQEWLRRLVLSEAGLINDQSDRFQSMTPEDFRETIEAGLGISSPADRKRVLARFGIEQTLDPVVTDLRRQGHAYEVSVSAAHAQRIVVPALCCNTQPACGCGAERCD